MKVKCYGMELPIFVFLAVVVMVSAYLDIIPNQLIGAVAVLFTIGIILGEIGDRIPIWNTFCGGGAMLCFAVAGILTYFNLMPECVIVNADGWMNGYNFLNLFIAILIVGSLLGMDRRVLIKSGAMFIPTILAGLVGAGIFGILAGLIFQKTPVEILISYVLPIMGGGIGSGAIPMAQLYEEVTGNDPAAYLSFALAILAVGNIVAVLFAVILNLVGRKFTKITGGNLLLRKLGKTIVVEEKEDKVPVTMDDIAAAVFLAAGFFMLGTLVSQKILPSVFGVTIPNFAYMIIFAMLANILNLIPEKLRAAAQKCQKFFGEKMVWVQMAATGIVLIDFEEMLTVLSFSNLFIVVMLVLGAVVGTMIFGWVIGFYPVESAITAGLCMANMGGGGDLAVLGAAKRMGLMSYAQISSRIGGAIVLLIGSLVFSFL